MPAVVLWGLVPAVLESGQVGGLTLTPAEQGRAARYVNVADRDSFVAAHLLARVCGMRADLPTAATTLTQRCALCGGPHGVPTFVDAPQLRVSLSHARGAVIAAVSADPVGVDVEPVRPLRPDDITPVLTTAERTWLAAQFDPSAAGLRIWCRKEAAAKAYGAGLELMPEIETVAAGRMADAYQGGRWTEAVTDRFRLCAFGTDLPEPARLDPTSAR